MNNHRERYQEQLMDMRREAELQSMNQVKQDRQKQDQAWRREQEELAQQNENPDNKVNQVFFSDQPDNRPVSFGQQRGSRP